MAKPAESLLVLCVIGAPGSGKGTLCPRLAAEFGLEHLSVGDYLRELAKHDEDIAEHLKRAELIPAAGIIDILRKKIDKMKAEGKLGNGLLLDGFPRRLDQALAFETEPSTACIMTLNLTASAWGGACAKDIQIIPPTKVCGFASPVPLARSRYLSRKLPGRLDDDEALFNKRLKEFQEENAGIVQHYEQLGKMINVDTSSDPDTSYKRLREAVVSSGLADVLLVKKDEVLQEEKKGEGQ